MLCINCGQKNEDEDKFCIKCGLTLKPSGEKRVEDVLFVPQKESKKTSTNWFLIIIAFFIVGSVFAVMISSISENGLSGSLSTSPTPGTVAQAWQTYISVEHGFSALFPTYPSITHDAKQSLDNGYSFTTTNISAVDDNGSDYYIQIGDYDIPSSNYDNKAGLEGMVNGMNNNGQTKVADTTFTKQNGFDAITFNFSSTMEEYEGKGMAIIRDDLENVKALLILIGSATGNTVNYQKFINSLEFR